jgi:hypothetical protein
MTSRNTYREELATIWQFLTDITRTPARRGTLAGAAFLLGGGTREVLRVQRDQLGIQPNCEKVIGERTATAIAGSARTWGIPVARSNAQIYRALWPPVHLVQHAEHTIETLLRA